MDVVPPRGHSDGGGPGALPSDDHYAFGHWTHRFL